MSIVYPGRYTAQLDGSFVLFIIGMRVNKHSSVPTAARPPKRHASSSVPRGALSLRAARLQRQPTQPNPIHH